MSISTKSGDEGNTMLFSGELISKSDLRVEAYGTIDELGAHISEAKHLVKSDEIRKILREIQDDLFKVAGSLASTVPYTFPVEEKDTERITRYVHRFEKDVKLSGFVIPGGNRAAAKLDVCRTVARRAERRIIALSEKAPLSLHLLSYVNRLSDLFFITARYEELGEGVLEEKKWS